MTAGATDAYQAAGLEYRLSTTVDEAELRALLQDTGLPSWVRLAFGRGPDFLAANRLMGEGAAVVAREAEPPGRLVGMYSHAWLPVYVNGRPERVGYLGGLRVASAFRHRLRVLRHGFESVRVLVREEGGLPWRFTSIPGENAPARRLLEAGLAGMPRYRPVGELVTLALPAALGRDRGRWRPARREDVPALAAFHKRQAAAWQFAPVLDEAWLGGLDGRSGLRLEDFLLYREGGEIAACLAVWDQRAFKHTLVHGYRPPLNWLRPAWNLWAALSGRPRLPSPGARLEEVYLAFAALPDRRPGLAMELLGEALTRVRARGGALGILALASEHPLLTEVQRRFHAPAYRTWIETVNWPEDPPPNLAAGACQPEAALL